MEILPIPEMEAMEIPTIYLRDAYAAAGNGDEISILGSGAFLNAEAAEPFIFDKSVTVNRKWKYFFQP